MRLKSYLKKTACYLGFSLFFCLSIKAFAYEPPSSPELFDKKGAQSENLTIKNSSGFTADITGAMGASLDFKNPSAFSYSGHLGLGYRFAVSSWNLWDIALELSYGLGGSSTRDICYPFGIAIRAGYGIPFSYKMNFFTYGGVGGSFAHGTKEDARILPGGFLGFQLEFLASKLVRVLVGPRLSLKNAFDSGTSKNTTTYFVPELNAGLRLKL